MSQNTSHAVMAQRIEAPDSLDFFPTPLWATRALIEHVIIGAGMETRESLATMRAWEPACGEGHMARPLAEYFGEVEASDCHDYGYGTLDDFLLFRRRPFGVDWVITNPPFRLAGDFVQQGLRTAGRGVAMLVRTAFLEGAARYRNLFDPYPPMIVAPFVERVPMLKGRLDAKASSATSYSWIVWRGKFHPGSDDTRLVWIPPCRKQLERPGDYESAEVAA